MNLHQYPCRVLRNLQNMGAGNGFVPNEYRDLDAALSLSRIVLAKLAALGSEIMPSGRMRSGDAENPAD